MRKEFYTLLFAIALSTTIATAQQPEGGMIYTMPQNVVAGGGGYSQWTQPDRPGRSTTVPNFEIEGTIGQAVTSTTTGGQFTLKGGFWFADDLQPTAAPASITGQITNLPEVGSNGRRIRVTLTNLRSGAAQTVQTNQFGYYQFDDLELEDLYEVRVEGPSMTFEPESVIVRLVDNITGVDFTAHPIQ